MDKSITNRWDFYFEHHKVRKLLCLSQSLPKEEQNYLSNMEKP